MNLLCVLTGLLSVCTGKHLIRFLGAPEAALELGRTSTLPLRRLRRGASVCARLSLPGWWT